MAPLPVGEDATPAWQAHLWRLLRARLPVPSPAERFADASCRLTDAPDLIDLPSRVSLFGLTRLPPSHLEVLQAMACGREVHLFLLHPSGQLWDRVAGSTPDPRPDLPRLADPTARLPANPLLRSWGRDARELQLVLSARGLKGGEYRPVDVTEAPAEPATLLGRLQADIRADRKPPGAPLAGAGDLRPELDPADRSLQIHSCHGRARQVEVGRDAVLHLLAADETLEPRDVIVMCPDIETFAPLIQAAFGPDDPVESPDAGVTDPQSGQTGTGLPRLRVRLADRSVRQTNPLLAVAASLLDLAGARVTASEVLDLASRPPVARRFQFDQDDLSTLQQWVTDTGVRWGLDAPHRSPWALDHVEANTWATGLNRLLLGVTMAEGDGRMFAGTLPYDDVASSEVDLAGRFAELVERLSATLDQLRGPQPVVSWVEALVAGTELLALGAPSERWQRDQAYRVLAEVADAAAPAPAAAPGTATTTGTALSLAEARELLGGRLQGRPTRANFRTGDLTVCTLVPMRSVPHRVVALLGLDDGAFPRRLETDGDDLLLASPRVGDRDARSEDRQLLLDALLAATEHLVITYSGHDDRTNRVRPPAVPVAELLDVVDQTVRLADDHPARHQVVVEHPLQPFDTRNFTAGHPLRHEPWSYDRVHLAGSRAAARQTPARPWLPDPLPPLDEPILQLDHLVRFVEHPVRAFLRNRLGLYLSDRNDEPADALPIELDALEKWGVGDRLLQACLAGTDPEVAAAAERARGFLPPGRVADDSLSSIATEVRQLAGIITALGFAPGPADSLDIHLDLPAGRGLIGTVADRRGETILVCTYSRLAPKHRLGAWVRFLALSAARPELDATVITIGRGAGRNPAPQVARLGPLGPTAPERRRLALEHLAVVLDLYDRGMQTPLPMACNTSAAWAEARRQEKDTDEAFNRANEKWDNGRFPGESSNPEHRYVWGPDHELGSLREELPAADEQGAGWAASEADRFGRLACRLWYPLLSHEQVRSIS